MRKKKLVVFTGAGISQESGIKTFRGSDGLWENHAISEVATPEAWFINPGLVLRFYNERRKQILASQPNAAHYSLAELEQQYDVTVVTQNIDDLHERAGSTDILHLHGEIRKAQSAKYPELVYSIEGDLLNLGEKCEKGEQLRPHVVWFGEAVPNIEPACKISEQADIFIVIGTSLNVYPAANLIHYTSPACQKFLIDPYASEFNASDDITIIEEKATVGMELLKKQLL